MVLIYGYWNVDIVLYNRLFHRLTPTAYLYNGWVV